MSKSILTRPARSGGGATMNKNVRTPIRGGSPNQRNITPDATQRGKAVGDHVDGAESGGRNTTKRPNAPLFVEARAPVEMGNTVAQRGCAVGADRKISRSGSQDQHGPVNPGSPRPVPQGHPISEFGHDVPGRRR
jgi:hypothetical protein